MLKVISFEIKKEIGKNKHFVANLVRGNQRFNKYNLNLVRSLIAQCLLHCSTYPFIPPSPHPSPHTRIMICFYTRSFLELQNRKSFNYNTKKCEHVHKTETDTQLVAENNENSESSLSLYEQLMQVDPERANQLHPNNVRKISRSLQIFHSTGKTHSKLMAEQKAQSGASGLSMFFCFPSLFFYTVNHPLIPPEVVFTNGRFIHFKRAAYLILCD